MKTENKIRMYLDDVRTPTDNEWIVVRDYNQLVNKIEEFGLDQFDVISLDHDLGDTAMIEYYNNVRDNYTIDYSNITEKTGYDVCKYLVNKSIETGIPLPQIYVHSANPIGSGNMMGYINNYLMNCRFPQTCVRVSIPHTISDELIMSPEARKAKWRKKSE
jgi:hypothetical protein